MESAFALTAGITCARSQFPTPADGDWTEGRGRPFDECSGPPRAGPRGRLAVRGGWRFLHLEGSPREMGLQHGRLLRPVVQRLFEEYMRMIRWFRMLSRAELLRRGRRLEPHIPARYLEEMRGLADGAAMAYDDILIAHTFLESVQAVQCSCFAAQGAATSDRELIFGRNLDFVSMGIAQRCGLIIFCKPDGGIPFISIAWPGWCGTITAVNLAGLCIGPLNVLSVSTNLDGTPYVISFRQMAQEAATCDEAVALLRATRRTYSNNILLAQTTPKRRAVVAEYTADEVVVREAKPGDDFIAATNHFRKLGRPEELPATGGLGRYASLVARLREHRGAIGLRTDLLADPRIHLPNSLHALVAAPERRTFRLAMGRMPAAEGPYRTFTYDERGIRVDG